MDSSSTIGGGAINEKPRLYRQSSASQSEFQSKSLGARSTWNPEQDLSHMLHALVGLDRYPNYLSRFQDLDDVIALENALELTLDKVRQQKNGMIEKKQGIRELIAHYNRLEGEKTAKNREDATNQSVRMAAANDDVEFLWSSELTPPKSWADLKQRNILKEDALKVAFQSMKSNQCQHYEVGDIIEGKVDFDLDPSLLEELMDQEMFDVYSFPLLNAKVSNDISCIRNIKSTHHLKLIILGASSANSFEKRFKI